MYKTQIFTQAEIKKVTIASFTGRRVYYSTTFNFVLGLIEITVKEEEGSMCSEILLYRHNSTLDYYSKAVTTLIYSLLPPPYNVKARSGSIGFLDSCEYYEGQLFHTNRNNIASKNYYCYINSDRGTKDYKPDYDYIPDYENTSPVMGCNAERELFNNSPLTSIKTEFPDASPF